MQNSKLQEEKANILNFHPTNFSSHTHVFKRTISLLLFTQGKCVQRSCVKHAHVYVGVYVGRKR